MTKVRIYALLLAGGIALSLAGCAGQHTLTEETGRTETNSQIMQTAEPEKEASAIETDSLLPAEDGSAPAEPETETPAAEPAEAQIPAEKEQRPETPAASMQTGQPQTPKQQTPEPSETAPQQGREAASQPMEQTEPAQAEPSTEPPAPEPETPAFDVGYWVSFAKGYAQSVGLELDSEATGCWDNPTAASAKSIYLERDLCGMLDKYNRDPDITAVWIWAEQRTETSWDIYIGYA